MRLEPKRGSAMNCVRSANFLQKLKTNKFSPPLTRLQRITPQFSMEYSLHPSLIFPSASASLALLLHPPPPPKIHVSFYCAEREHNVSYAAFDDDNHPTSQNYGGSTVPSRFEVKMPSIKPVPIEDARRSSTLSSNCLERDGKWRPADVHFTANSQRASDLLFG